MDNLVNGINFIRNNGYEVSVFNEKGNRFLNSSFESGACYFHDHNAGFNVRDMLTARDARSGRYSLLLTRGANAFPFPTQAERNRVWRSFGSERRLPGRLELPESPSPVRGDG